MPDTVLDFLREAAQAEGLSLRAYCKRAGILYDFRRDPVGREHTSEVSLDGYGGAISDGRAEYDHCPACRRRREAQQDADQYD